MMRPLGREVAGAVGARAAAAATAGIAGDCLGEGACKGARGRGIVDVWCEGRRRKGCFARAGFACCRGAVFGSVIV